MSKVIGCDVGGTFTDLILLDEAAGEVSISKVPSTPEEAASAQGGVRPVVTPDFLRKLPAAALIR